MTSPFDPLPYSDIQPVSIRFLVPEIDAAVAIDGRIVDVLTICYRTEIDFGGRPVPCEFYFTTITEGVNFSLPVPTPWDMPWDRGFPRQRCDLGYKYEKTDGTNPCPYSGTAQPTPIPDDWEYPEILVGTCGGTAGTDGEVDIIVVDDDHELWWY